MTSTERTTALGGDEAAEQRSAVGDLVEALTAAAKAFESIREGAIVQSEAYWNEATINGLADAAEKAETEARAALAKYATQGTGGGENPSPSMLDAGVSALVEARTYSADDRESVRAIWACMSAATHQPAISTDIGSFSPEEAKIPGGDASNGAADHEGAGE